MLSSAEPGIEPALLPPADLAPFAPFTCCVVPLSATSRSNSVSSDSTAACLCMAAQQDRKLM